MAKSTLKSAPRKATSADVNRDTLASAAGLTTPETNEVPFDPTTETFKVVVSNAIGPFTEGQVLEAPYQWSNLPEQKHITTYYDLALTDTVGEHELKPKQIWVAIQAVETAGLDTPDAIDEARISYLQSVQSSSQAMSHEQFVKFLTTNEVAAAAVKLGQEVSEELQLVVETGIDSKKIWDGTPIKVEAELVKHYGDNALSSMPIVNSRKTGKTKKGTNISTDTVPADYIGLTDYFIGDVEGEPRIVRWFQLFVEAMPHVKQLVNRRDLLSTMKKTPAALDAKTIPSEYMEIWNGGAPDNMKLDGLRADIAGDISKYVNRVTQAVAFYQAKKAISEHLSKTVSYELVGGSVEETFKRTKPIQMLVLKEVEGRIRETASMSPIALSKFIRYGRNAERCKHQGGSLAKLDELSKVVKKAIAKPVTGATDVATSYKIEKASQLEDVVANAADYMANHEAIVSQRLADQRDGGHFCFALVALYQRLEAIVDAEDGLVRKRADNWNKDQIEAASNMERDDAERKRNLAKVA